MKSMYISRVCVLLGFSSAIAFSAVAQTAVPQTNIPTSDSTVTTTPPATATSTTRTVSTTPAAPPHIDYSSPQGILEALRTEPGTMRIEDYQYSPQEEEDHVKRMVRLAELRSGQLSVDEIRHLLGFRTDAEKQAEADAQKLNDTDHMRSEVDDLRQQVQDLRQMLQQQNPAMMNSYRSNHRHQSP